MLKGAQARGRLLESTVEASVISCLSALCSHSCSLCGCLRLGHSGYNSVTSHTALLRSVPALSGKPVTKCLFCIINPLCFSSRLEANSDFGYLWCSVGVTISGLVSHHTLQIYAAACTTNQLSTKTVRVQ